MSTVIAFGTFDYFHAGHESYLHQAKALEDKLIVVVARDETALRIKGKYPDHKEKVRLSHVRASGITDKVVLGSLTDKYEVIRTYRPSIIALGYDQFTFTFRLKKLLIEEKMNAQIVRMQPYQPEIYKTSLIKALI